MKMFKKEAFSSSKMRKLRVCDFVTTWLKIHLRDNTGKRSVSIYSRQQ